ncbi:MAG: glutaminase A [Candidatus Binatia bacterium]
MSDTAAQDFSPILSCLRQLYEKYRNNFDGQVATYIPELAKANPQIFGIALMTADGQAYEVGDSRHLFSIQSISKPFVYGLALQQLGVDYVLTKVGVEPSGEAFNSIVFDERRNRPFNPMVNAGAIATAALIHGEGHDRRLACVLKMFGRFAGRPVEIDRDIFASERATGHRNRAIAHLERNAGMIDERIDEHLDLYFEQCSILVSAKDLAVMAATLANNGVNPVTGERALDEPYVKNVLSVMHSCGMYDYAGEWGYRIGLAAKSGVGGGIIAVLPGQFGIGVFSPLLDPQGNSCRGIKVCEELSQRFKLHLFKTRAVPGVVIRRRSRGTAMRSKRIRSSQEQAILDRKGASICVYELQGNLFFGSLEQVFRKLAAELDSLSYIILDLKRVLEIDDCAVTLLADMETMLAEKDKQLILAHFPVAAERSLGEQPEVQWSKSFFPDTDAALESCENQLLAEENLDRGCEKAILELQAMDLLAGFDADEIALLHSIVQVARYGASETIVREGDPADALFLLAGGLVNVCLRLGDGTRRKRLATIAPGVAFGELAIFDGGTRSADVIADQPAICYVLPLAKLDDLAALHPGIRTKLLSNIGRELSARLRRADAEIRSLEE